MAHESSTPIINVADGFWKHIRYTQVSHRRYPWVRGEGRSLRDAATDLLNQLTRAFDFVHGRDREGVGRAIADVKAFQSKPHPGLRPRRRVRSLAPSC